MTESQIGFMLDIRIKFSDRVGLYSNLYSCIIGEVDIIDCVINHPSIWAEKNVRVSYLEEDCSRESYKPIYNWVLANPVKYEQPILNVKGKLSFWEY